MRFIATTSILALALFASVSQASEVPAVCAGQAESFLETQEASSDHYDVGGFMTVDCGFSTRGSAVVCDVAASKGDGAATDTFMVVMNKKCTRLFRIILTGEE